MIEYMPTEASTYVFICGVDKTMCREIECPEAAFRKRDKLRKGQELRGNSRRRYTAAADRGLAGVGVPADKGAAGRALRSTREAYCR